MMKDPVRESFETVCYPNFPGTGAYKLKRKPNGEYISDSLEDHWQTFQEGWEEAVKHIQNKSNETYSDIISDGGMDPR